MAQDITISTSTIFAVVIIAMFVALLFVILDGFQTAMITPGDARTATDAGVVFSGGSATMTNPKCTAVLTLVQS